MAPRPRRPRRRLLAAVAVLLVAAVLPPAAAAPAPAGRAPSAAPAAPARAAADPSSAIRPLVIVLDTSGSMEEDDGTGTIKLAGAQRALSDVIRRQRPGSQIGLWTYPTGADCGPGRFRIPVGPLDQRSMIRSIRRLDANGGTPTGEALRAVTRDLRDNGYAGATILLISDGLSTCDADPCDVARQVTADGFDLTVDTAGFRISRDGLRELSCIARATGGQTYHANDSDDLNEVVSEATRAELTLEVSGIPSETPAGSASRVTVRVANESAIDVEDARIAFTFGADDSGQQGVIPAVLPPLERIGNLPAGAAATRSWIVSYGTRGKTGETDYRISAWGSNAQPRSVTGTVDVTDDELGWDQAGGDLADLEGQRIAILGDSYSSGEGAGSYLPGTDQNQHFGDNQCHKSPLTYMYPLFPADEQGGESDDVELIACSGATTHHIGDDPASGVREEQVPLLRERQEDAGPVAAAFMTVGGNDIKFGQIVTACVKLGTCSDDQEFTDWVDGLVDGLGAELRPTYELVYKTLNDADAVEERGGLAPLYVLPYPQPFPERQWASWCRGFNAAEIGWANDLVDDLDNEIEKAVGAMRRSGYHVDYVAPVQEAFLPDNTACPRPGAQEYVNSVTLGEGIGGTIDQGVLGINYKNEYMHPNARGYRTETNAILAWSVNTPDELPPGVDEWRPPPDPTWWDSPVATWLARHLTPPLPSAGTAAFDATTGEFTSEPLDARGGQRFDVGIVHAAPGATVLLTLQSRARVVGTAKIGEDGTGTVHARIPPLVAAGEHRLTVMAVADDGSVSVGSQQIDVARAIPAWLLPVAVATLVMLLLAAVFDRLERRRRRRTASS